MGINYVPFLKSKQNEIHALSEMDLDLVQSMCPFFDYPKKQNGATNEVDVSKTINSLVKKFSKYLNFLNAFYFDIYDIDELNINGTHVYAHLLQKFSEFPIIPVVGIDRSEQHQESVLSLKKSGTITSNVVAFRITQEDFQSFSVVHNDIEEILSEVFYLFSSIDLVFDCRICTNTDVKKTASEIANFAESFGKIFSIRNIIISGSSIPASVAEVLQTNNEENVHRVEIDIFNATAMLSNQWPLIFGDYTTISPDYSDVDIPPEQMQNRITAKIIYSFDNKHFFIRGGSLKAKGRGQYFDLAEKLCAKPFFRYGNSVGDKYFEEKGKRIGAQCYVNTVIKPAINSHMTFVAQKILAGNSV